MYFCSRSLWPQRGKRPPEQKLQTMVRGHRIMYFCSGRFGPTWKEATGAEIADDGYTIVSQVRFVICTRLVKLWRCRNFPMFGVLAARRTARRSTGRCALLKWPANKDARQLGAAAAVSSERLQEVFDRLSGSLPFQAVTQNGSKLARPSESKPSNCMWSDTASPKHLPKRMRAYCSKRSKFRAQMVQNVAQRLQQEATGMRAEATVTKHGSGWRARVKGAQTQVNGPTRQSKAAAEVDAGRLQAAHQSSTEELYKPWLSGCSRKLLM